MELKLTSMTSNLCMRLHAFVCRLVEKYGEGQWATISQQLNKAFGKPDEQGRIGKQCREVRAHGDVSDRAEVQTSVHGGFYLFNLSYGCCCT